MNNTYCIAMIGLFTFLTAWGLIVLEHQEREKSIVNQEQVVVR